MATTDTTQTVSSGRTGDVRLDVQLLRAVAVGIVVIYHLWPGRLPGGFVGVDVFFVISGFLITSHLLRTATGRGVDVIAFWGNRARRLLPLACFVLLATVAGIRLWMPPSTWKASLENVLASVLYVQNWKLSSDAVDYLARDRSPVPTRHFWSLSAEEQFYLAWPLLVVLGTALAIVCARRTGRDRVRAIRRSVLGLLLIVTTFSFGYSLWLTDTSPALAYFSTTTRAWEFGAGALLAFLPSSELGHVRNTASSRLVRAGGSWAGIGLILAASVLIDGSYDFPGVAALAPVVGAALFIAAGDTGFWFAPTVLARVRPITWIGDVSYGIYLWHWPLIVLAPFALGVDELGTAAKLGVGAGSIVLAGASKALVEDPFRFGTVWRVNRRRSFYPALAGMLTVCGTVWFGLHQIQASVVAPVAADAAPRLDRTAGTDPDEPLRPSLVGRAEDKTIMYDCFNLFSTGDDLSCTYGDVTSPVSIAIVGDSHSAHFLPGLIDVVDQRGWKLTTHVGVDCDTPLGADCAGGKDMYDAITSSDFDLVLYSDYRGARSTPSAVADYLTDLDRAGVPIVPIIDVPRESEEAFECVEDSGGDAGRASRCSTPRDVALDETPDRNGPVAEKLGIPVIDLTDVFCGATRCEAVINNVIVHSDTPASHLTTTFSRLLAPRLEKEIVKALAARGVPLD